MIQKSILDKLKQGDQYVVNTGSRSSSKKINETAKLSTEQQALAKFQETLLSVHSSKPAYSVSQRDSKGGKRVLLKSIKGGPAIPMMQYGRLQEAPPLITQSLPQLKYKTLQNRSDIITSQQSQSKPVIQTKTSFHEKQQRSEKQKEFERQQQEAYLREAKLQYDQQEDEQPQLSEQDQHIQCMVEQHMTEYEAYIRHLSGKCICVQCPCGRCKCQYQYHPVQPNLQKNSSYQIDFKTIPIQEQDIKINPSQFNQVKSVDQCDYKTTMTMDYKPYEVMPPGSKEKRLYQPTFGQTPISTYKNFYMDYGNLHYEQFKQGHYKTVIPELPFISNTTYGINFRPQEATETKLVRPHQTKPFPTVDLFLGQSSNKTAYPPKKIDNTQLANNGNNVAQIPAYNGQYLSVTHADYKKKEIHCQRYKAENDSQQN